MNRGTILKISLKCGYDGYLYRTLFKCSVNCMEHRLNIWISNYLLEHTLLVIQLFESFPLGGVESLPRCTNSCGNNGVAVYPYKQLRKRKEVIIVSHCISDFFPSSSSFHCAGGHFLWWQSILRYFSCRSVYTFWWCPRNSFFSVNPEETYECQYNCIRAIYISMFPKIH